MISLLAPAKVNLYLHVGAPGPDGYHPLVSLVTFADVGDLIGSSRDEVPAFELRLEGAFAAALRDEPDNLVVRAIRELAEIGGGETPRIRLHLWKELPIAAGLGGGSSDAAAALRLVRPHFPDVSDDQLMGILGRLGADAPMCLAARPVIASGRGDVLSPAPPMPPMHAVLVNPGVACPTPQIYAAFDRAGRFQPPAPGALREAYGDVRVLAGDLAHCRNDLEPVACAFDPRVGEPIDLLSSRPETLLARLSGSGATSFALCAGQDEAAALADYVSTAQPSWWVKACTLGAPSR